MRYNFSRIPKLRLVAWLSALVAVGGVAAGTIRYGSRQATNAAVVHSFNKQFMYFPDLKNAKGGGPYILGISGKVVVLNKREGTVDPLYQSLKDDLRANTVDEVGTVIWLEWGEQLVGRYTGGGGAYVHTCAVSIIDRSTSTLIEKRYFTGSQPPSSKKGRGAGYGSKPDDEILSFIESLPRK